MIIFEYILIEEKGDHFQTNIMAISKIFYHEFKKQGYNTHIGTKKAILCKLRYEKLTLKCQCEFDWYGHRTGTCDKCLAILKLDKYEKEMDKKFGKDITQDCNCKWSRKIKNRIQQRINNQNAEEFGKIINQISNKQRGHENWTQIDIEIYNIMKL
jgi:hypothetical protein